MQRFVIHEGDPRKNHAKEGEVILYVQQDDGPLEFFALFNSTISGKPDIYRNNLNARRTIEAFEKSGVVAVTDKVALETVLNQQYPGPVEAKFFGYDEDGAWRDDQQAWLKANVGKTLTGRMISTDDGSPAFKPDGDPPVILYEGEEVELLTPAREVGDENRSL